MPTLDVRLLGSFRATYDGELVETLGSPRLQSLLAYLLLHRDTLPSRQHVAFLFWPDSTEAQARTNLRKALYDLRRVLPDADAFVVADGQTIAWVSDASYTLDVATFEAALDEAERAEGHEQRPDETVQALSRAIDLYAGDLLPSCYDDWILPDRQGLRTRYIGGLEQLAALLEQTGDTSQAIEQMQRLLREEPLYEPGHRRLMRLLAANGQRTLALAQYEECARLLEEELGVEPEAETRRLYEEIRAGELAVPQERMAPQWETTLPLHNLPASLTPLIGRETELAELEQLLEDPACRLVTLSGAGGSGKTRLALEVAAQQVGRYRHGVYWIGLAETPSADAIVPVVAKALGFPCMEEGIPCSSCSSFCGSARCSWYWITLSICWMGREPCSASWRRRPG
jgi:DNA-binding SARP family transcriptional activator